jgi:CubicO group peptidase (beta-lactamase class C family)
MIFCYEVYGMRNKSVLMFAILAMFFPFFPTIFSDNGENLELWLKFLSSPTKFAQTDQNRGSESDSDIETKVDAYVKPYIDAGGFSGAILMAKNGRIMLEKGYGMANYELDVPNTPQTKFHIASVSKTFTAAAIMILEQKRKLSTDEVLTKFIPDYPAGDKITIHHLLTHTSGIPNVNAFPEYEEKSRFHNSLEDIIDLFKNKPLDFNPGERYSYSNSNYNLLASIIEKVSGLSYGAFLQQNIFAPLDMKDTAHDSYARAIIKNQASGYQPAGSRGIENAPYLDWIIKTGNGSIYSTIEDLYKWDRALYTEKILTESSKKKMFTDHIDGVGYGWFIRKRNNRRVTDMNGRSPGFTSYLRRFIDDDACIIVLSNNYSPASHMMVNGLGAMLFDEKYEMLEEIKPIKVDEKVLDGYLGHYKFADDFYIPNAEVLVIKGDGHLALQWSEDYVSPLLTLSKTKFLDRFFWASIIFVKNDKGEVTQLIWRDEKDYIAKKIED